jgi:hypothetical protein
MLNIILIKILAQKRGRRLRANAIKLSKIKQKYKQHGVTLDNTVLFKFIPLVLKLKQYRLSKSQ